jgi:hypothetical protein
MASDDNNAVAQGEKGLSEDDGIDDVVVAADPEIEHDAPSRAAPRVMGTTTL